MNFEKIIVELFNNRIANIVVYDGKPFNKVITAEHFTILPATDNVNQLLKGKTETNVGDDNSISMYHGYRYSVNETIYPLFDIRQILDDILRPNSEKDNRRTCFGNSSMGYRCFYACMSKGLYDYLNELYNDIMQKEGKQTVVVENIGKLDEYGVFESLADMADKFERTYLENLKTAIDIMSSDRRLLGLYKAVLTSISGTTYTSGALIVKALNLYLLDVINRVTLFDYTLLSRLHDEIKTIINMLIAGRNSLSDMAAIYKFYNRNNMVNIVTDMFRTLEDRMIRNPTSNAEEFFVVKNLDFYELDVLDSYINAESPGRVKIQEITERRFEEIKDTDIDYETLHYVNESFTSMRETIKSRYADYITARKEKIEHKKRKKLNLLILDIGREIEILKSRSVNLITETEKQDTLTQLYDLKYELSSIKEDATKIDDYTLVDAIDDKISYIDDIIDVLQGRQLRLERRTIHLKLDKTFTDQVKDK